MNNPAHYHHTWNVFGDNLFAISSEEAEHGDFGRVKVCHGPCATGHWKGVTVRPSTSLSAAMSLHITWVSVSSLKINYLKSG